MAGKTMKRSRSKKKSVARLLLGQSGAIGLSRKLEFKRPQVLMSIAAVVVVGTAILLYTHAATNAGNAEAENGTIAGNATIVSDSNASGGKGVKFGSGTQPTPTATATPSSTPAPTPTPAPGSVTPNGISGTWNLKFDDEFNGTALNSKYWSCSWFGGGTMNNVSTPCSNETVSGGNLIQTLASSSSGSTVDTDPSQTGGGGYQYGTGYVAEARVYFPGNGTTIYNWPGFWDDGQNWPADGEEDIIEGLGTATSNYHSNSGANNSGTIPGIWSNGWHTYAVDRESGKNYIYWDGKLVRSYSTNDGGSPHYLIMTVGCSGGCVTGAASQVKTDYIRVWQKG